MIKKKGFTLIELLVVIAIIGILTSVLTVSFSTARKASRDAKRISDLHSIKLALEAYYNDYLTYPTNIYNTFNGSDGFNPSMDGLAGRYLSIIPTDPSSTAACTAGNQPSCYFYWAYASDSVMNNCSSLILPPDVPINYHLGTKLEQKENPALSKDQDAPVSGGIWTGERCSNPGSGGEAFDGTSADCNSTPGVPQPGGNATEACYDLVR
jgi:prepilin-type N-terminal cleavage/methylation domain-containing protein